MGQAFCGEVGSVDVDDPEVDKDEGEKDTGDGTRLMEIVSEEEAEIALAKSSSRTAALTESDKRVLRATWRVLDLDRTSIGTQFVLM